MRDRLSPAVAWSLSHRRVGEGQAPDPGRSAGRRVLRRRAGHGRGPADAGRRCRRGRHVPSALAPSHVTGRDQPAPGVTVVIPTFNRWRVLSARALPSALAQEDVDLEVVVVVDGSTDETASGLESLEDERVRVVRHARPLGLHRARNAGIAAARGEWVAFLDDDDVWAPWKLRTQLALVNEANASF